MSVKTCNLQKGAGNLRVKNCGHTTHDATCSAHVHLYLLRTHTTPLGVCRVAGVRVAGGARTCNFLQDNTDLGNPQFFASEGLGHRRIGTRGDQQNGDIRRARDVDSDNESTGNDTP